MIDTPTRNNLRDFRQRYEGTYGFVVTENGKEVVLINRVNDRNVEFTDKFGHLCAAVVGSGVDFEFSQVVFGWHPTDEGPLLMSRVPARMWQRGVSPQNTALYRPGKNGRLLTESFEIGIISSVYNHVKTPTKTPEVLSKHFACAHGHFWFLDQVVGTVKDTVITLNDFYDVRQEVGDTIRRNGYGYTINE